MASIPNKYDVSVLIETPAEAVRSFLGHWGNVEEVTATSCRIRMNVDDLGWPTMVLGLLASPFVIESPVELRERVRTAGETLMRAAEAS